MKEQNGKSTDPLELREVLCEELTLIRGVNCDSDRLDDVFAKLNDHRLRALSLSGGGIRSAAFALGLVQAMAKQRLLTKVDYMSTVSGGGYLGSWLSAWIYRSSQENRVSADEGVIDGDVGAVRVEQRVNRGPIDVSGPNSGTIQVDLFRESSSHVNPTFGLFSADMWTSVAIHLRNTALYFLIFVPLIAALLIIPRALFLGVVTPERLFDVSGRRIMPEDSSVDILLLLTAAAAVTSALVFVISRLPSKTQRRRANANRFFKFVNTDAGVVAFGVGPLIAAAYIGSILWARYFEFGAYALNRYTYWLSRYSFDSSLGSFLIVSMAVCSVALVIFTIARFRQAQRDFVGVIAALIAALVEGALLWLACAMLLPAGKALIVSILGTTSELYVWQIYLCISVPILLSTVLLSGLVYVILTSRTATDDDGAWLARYSSWIVVASGGWFLLNALVLLAPSIVQWIFDNWRNPLPLAGIPTFVSTSTAIVTAVIAILSGFIGKRSAKDEEPSKSLLSRFFAFIRSFFSGVLVGTLFILLAYSINLVISWYFYRVGGLSGADHAIVLRETPVIALLLTFAFLFIAGFLMACFVDINRYSFHSAYRDRLTRAFLGGPNLERSSNAPEVDDRNDKLELWQLSNQRPLHIINATVNLTSGKDLGMPRQKAASFTMSALHCGSWAVNGYRRSRDYCQSRVTARSLRLGTAMAISGATSDPSRGYYPASTVSGFVMSLLNARLGWWMANPGPIGSVKDKFGFSRQRIFEKTAPSIAVLPVLNETFGRADEDKRFLMVTDGGHFENLGLYEMVLRRCSLMIVSDCSVDESFQFGDLGKAIQLCKSGLGVEIEFTGLNDMRPRSAAVDPTTKKSRFAIGKVTYPERRENGESRLGWILYLRPTYYETTEPLDVRYYARVHETFPHQSTSDQTFDEKQFEAYRELGYYSLSEVHKIMNATAKGDPSDLVDEVLEKLFNAEHDFRRTMFEFFDLGDYFSFRPRSKSRGTTSEAHSSKQVLTAGPVRIVRSRRHRCR